MKSASIAQAACAALLAVACASSGHDQQEWEALWEPDEVVYRSASWKLAAPPGATAQEHQSAMTAQVRGEPLPAGWAVAESLGSIEARYAGRHDEERNAKLVTVVLEDEREDLASAELRIDGDVVHRATRANGAIQSEDGMARATMPLWVPQPPVEVELRWTAADGEERHESLHVVSHSDARGSVSP